MCFAGTLQPQSARMSASARPHYLSVARHENQRRQDRQRFLETHVDLPAEATMHRQRAAAAKKLHAAQARRKKEFLRSIGVPDLSPEEITDRARR
jgi:hypothetical protein